jgi:hypothetical protein
MSALAQSLSGLKVVTAGASGRHGIDTATEGGHQRGSQA